MNDEKDTKSVLIIGNGSSRLKPDIQQFINQIYNQNIPVWACNYSFQEKNIGCIISLMASVHYGAVLKASEYRQLNNIHFDITCPSNFIERYKIPSNEIIPLTTYLGFSTGNELINLALNRGYEKIYLVGFDSIMNENNCIYSGKVIIGNFKKQLYSLIETYKLKMYNYEDNRYINVLERKKKDTHYE